MSVSTGTGDDARENNAGGAAPASGASSLSAASTQLLNAFTVDVEEYFQVSAFERQFPRSAWDSIGSRLDIGLDALLRLAAEAEARGTFYFLGWTAERRPELLRRVISEGHEIGCHSFDHRLVYEMSEDDFRLDLRRALDAIQNATGEPCRLYRAPSFSVIDRSLWALEVLAEEGIRIDSSIYPIRHDRYGIRGAPRHAYRPLPGRPEFVEVPPSTVRIAGVVLPCAGGGYLRLYPMTLTKAAMRRINRREGQPVVVYVHPWEFDPEQPRVDAGILRNARHRVNIGRMRGRMALLLRSFRFAPLSEVVNALGGAGSIPLISPREVRS